MTQWFEKLRRHESEWLKAAERIGRAQNKHGYLKDWFVEIWVVALLWCFRGGLSFVLLVHAPVSVV